MTEPIAFDMSPPPPTKVDPTVEGRVAVYDFIRGIAILGILLANIPAFGNSLFATMLDPTAPLSPIDATVSAWTGVLVTGKFRTMLAMLFGIGIYLQYQKRSEVQGNWPGGYLKRTIFLMLFGLIHGILIWYGDILFLYSLVAFVVCLFAGFSDRVLIWLASVSFGLAVLAGIGATLAAGLVDPATIKEAMTSGGMPQALTLQAEMAAYANGSFLDQVAHRAQAFLFLFSSLIFFCPLLGGFFVLGLLFGRHGVLAKPSAHPKTVRRFLLLGLGLGLPLTAAVEFLIPSGAPFIIAQAVEILYGPLVATGLIMLLAVMSERGVLPNVQSAIAKVGRTAFSCYIMQSLICTAIFYSWGGGLFGKLNRLEMLIVVPFVWAANLIFAHYWLKKYRMGPLEWLWRSLTESRKMELRRQN